MTLRELCSRLTGLLRRRDPDPDLEDEIASHLELAKADYLRRGMTEAEAQRLAAMKFGSVAGAREHVWEQRQVPGLGALLQDARYAARGMRKSPGFTIVTVATLALGIGLCSVIYALLNAIILRSLPGVPEPDRLALVQGPVPYPWFESYRDHDEAAWAAAAFIGPAPFDVAIEGAAGDRITGALVSPEYFATLRVQPLLGRIFDPQLEKVGGAPTLVITERFWRTHLRADPGVIGRTLRVNGRAVPIIGVGPRDFSGAGMAMGFKVPEIFIPATANASIAPELQHDALHRTTQPAFHVLLRLAPGTTLAAAESRLDWETRVLAKQPRDKGRLVHLMPAGTAIPVPKEARILVVTFYGVLVAVILGLTCANLGGMLLARGAARGKEFAIRLSIGAHRFRLIRQLLTESAILAIAGGVGSLVAANAIFRLMRSITDANPIMNDLTSGPDLKGVLFIFAVAVLAALGFGIVPALAVTSLDLTNAMKANLPTGLRRHRRLGLRNMFVVCQMAAAMMLMLIMGFFVIGAQQGLKTEPGFDPRPVSFFSVDPLRDGLSPSESAALLRGLPERLARVAGVESVSLADQPPLSMAFPNTTVSVPSLKTRTVAMESVGPRFFTTLGASVLRGTDFGDRDLRLDDGSGKILPAVINQAAANELFGNADPLGRRIQQDQRTFEVAGVVRYVPRTISWSRPVPMVFVPLTANDLDHGVANGITVVIRARRQIAFAVLRRELSAIDARLTLFDPQTIQQYLVQFERTASVYSAFYLPIGGFGLILACLGIAGVTAQAVQRRRKEIGIRMALGARQGQLLRLVLRESAVMAVFGAVLGFAGASALARLLSAISADMAQIIAPAISNRMLIVGIPSFLILLAAVACYVPARRSVTTDPLIVLREE
jgi:macrolide transport system ATP-binding/permease protein